MNRFQATLSVLFIVLKANISFAQVEVPIKITKGLKGGINFANFHGADAESDFKNAFIFGGFVGVTLSNLITVQPELLYSGKGAKQGSESNRVKYKLNYLEIPVLLKFKVLQAPKVKPGLYLGPAVAIKINAKRELQENGETSESDLEGIRTPEIGFAIGGTIDFYLGVGAIVFDARYTNGFNSIFEAEGIEVKNGVFSFMAGLLF
jgi:hypothetical protein